MAFFTQAMKAERAPAIAKLAKEYGVKLSMKVDNGKSFVVTLLSGSIDFMNDYNETRKVTRWYQNPQVQDYVQLSNHCNFAENFSNNKAIEFLTKLTDIAMQGNFDDSDLMTDYHNVGFYFNLHIGKWNKYYIFNK